MVTLKSINLCAAALLTASHNQLAQALQLQQVYRVVRQATCDTDFNYDGVCDDRDL